MQTVTNVAASVARFHEVGGVLDFGFFEDADGSEATLIAAIDATLPLLVEAGWRVIMFSGTVPETVLADAVGAGADGWLHKKAPFEELLVAVLAAARGEQLMTPHERDRLVRERRERRDRGPEECCANWPPAGGRRRSPPTRWCR